MSLRTLTAIVGCFTFGTAIMIFVYLGTSCVDYANNPQALILNNDALIYKEIRGQRMKYLHGLLIIENKNDVFKVCSTMNNVIGSSKEFYKIRSFSLNSLYKNEISIYNEQCEILLAAFIDLDDPIINSNKYSGTLRGLTEERQGYIVRQLPNSIKYKLKNKMAIVILIYDLGRRSEYKLQLIGTQAK